MTEVADRITNAAVSDPEFKIVGTRPIRHDGYEKVTGAARYGADIHPPGLLHGKVLRSPHAHARIISIDTSRAEAHPDVRAVVTSKDFPDVPEGQERNAYNKVLAWDKTTFKGHPIAAVAAVSPHVAEEAMSLIDVEYEVLPAVTNIQDAMKPGAPRIYEHLKGNVARTSQVSKGDVEKGFRDAEVVVEREFTTTTVHQGYIEPHTATASWGADDRITLWCSTQGHFPIGESTAKLLRLPVSSVKVIPMEIGGGFGGKTLVYLEPLAVMLSRKTGQPVKLTMSRAEVLEASGPTSGTQIKVKMGTTRDGKLTAAQAALVYEGGGFPGGGSGGGAACIFSPYDCDNILIDGTDVVTNKPGTAAYRAPGAPMAAFAGEQVVDELSRKLGMDPLDFRVMNGAREGTRMASGVAHPKIGCIETAEAARAHDHYSTPLEGPNRGRGVASGYWMNGAGPACATANVNADGRVSLTIGTVDIGGTRATAAQQFAEVLGIPAEDVDPQVGDTTAIGYSSMTGGSSVTFKTGWACYEAGQDVKRQMIERAALLWETSADQVELMDGVFRHRSDPEPQMSFKELAAGLNETGGPVVGRANLSAKGAGAAYATNIVDLEVDPDTGKVTILRYTAFQDAGKAIHPGYVEGQMQGGVVQGIGWALNEEYFMGKDGSMLNSSFLDYRMPTSLDLPMIDTQIVEVPNPLHPYGVRGVAEVSLVPPMAAIANAIHDAIGVRMTDLPMNPQAVVKVQAEQNGG